MGSASWPLLGDLSRAFGERIPHRNPLAVRVVLSTVRKDLGSNGVASPERERACECRLFGAERAGFEPAVGFDPYAALAKRCFRPLSHLSEWCRDFTSPANG